MVCACVIKPPKKGGRWVDVGVWSAAADDDADAAVAGSSCAVPREAPDVDDRARRAEEEPRRLRHLEHRQHSWTHADRRRAGSTVDRPALPPRVAPKAQARTYPSVPAT